MADEIIFANGIIFKLPRNGAPSFVKGSISFKVDEAIQWIKDNADGEWCNIDLKVSQQGKPYASLNTWKPNGNRSNVPYPPKEAFSKSEEDIPF